jgi:tRNA(fMet)-specific endonuclease VapC
VQLLRKPKSVHRRFRVLTRSEIAVSAIVAAELYYGARRHPTRSDAIRLDIVDFLSRLVVLPWRAEEHYALRCESWV